MRAVYMGLLLLIGSVAQAEEFPTGLYLGTATTLNYGTFRADVSAFGVSANVLKFSVRGTTQSICGGYRTYVGSSAVTVGGELCGEFGVVHGSQTFTREVRGVPAHLQVGFESDREYLARVMVGYHPPWAPAWHGELSYGASAATAQLWAVASYASFVHAETLDGWMLGETYGVTVSRQLSDHASVRFMYDVVSYRYREDRLLGNLDYVLSASERTERFSVLLEYTF